VDDGRLVVDGGRGQRSLGRGIKCPPVIVSLGHPVPLLFRSVLFNFYAGHGKCRLEIFACASIDGYWTRYICIYSMYVCKAIVCHIYGAVAATTVENGLQNEPLDAEGGKRLSRLRRHPK